jgi:hypothetical protein
LGVPNFNKRKPLVIAGFFISTFLAKHSWPFHLPLTLSISFHGK